MGGFLGLSGRIKSGKGHVSDYLIQKYGFERVTLAAPLKDAISKLYGLDISYCYDQGLKSKKLDLPWDKSHAERLAQIFGLDIDNVWYPEDSPIVFEDVRQALQYIGSDVLRRFDNDFHINLVLKALNPDKDYVCDDVRFLNEKNAIERFGGQSLLIIRPNQWEFSNHISETSLNCTHFDNIIINDKDLSALEKKIDVFKSGFVISNSLKTFLSINEESAYFAGLVAAAGRIRRPDDCYVLEFSHKDEDLVNCFVNFMKVKVPVDVKDNLYRITIDSVFILENLKLWDMKPGKIWEEVPEILLRPENEHLIGCWFGGFLDGNG